MPEPVKVQKVKEKKNRRRRHRAGRRVQRQRANRAARKARAMERDDASKRSYEDHIVERALYALGRNTYLAPETIEILARRGIYVGTNEWGDHSGCDEWYY
jgi:ribosomal protein L2